MVLGAVVELVLLLVEAVHDVARAAAGQVAVTRREAVGGEDSGLRAGPRVLRDKGLDAERIVREMARERRRGGGVCAVGRLRWRGEVHIVLQEARVGRSGRCAGALSD